MINVLYFLTKTIVLIITFISFTSLSHAHAYSAKYEIKNKSIIQVVPIVRTQSKLLPKELYVRTLGHTFKRKFAFQNKMIKKVYFDAYQPNHKLYASLMPTNTKVRLSRSYWP